MDEINATKKKRERHFKSRYKSMAMTNIIRTFKIFKTVIMDRKYKYGKLKRPHTP
jgi:hypothetical protein